MIFDMTVCGACLEKELSILQGYLPTLRSSNIGLMAIIGVADKKEESHIITKYQFGDIAFPFIFEKPGTIYRTFKLDQTQYLDSPFYIFTSRNLNVLDVYKSPYMEAEELETWLNSILNQKEF